MYIYKKKKNYNNNKIKGTYYKTVSGCQNSKLFIGFPEQEVYVTDFSCFYWVQEFLIQIIIQNIVKWAI
jgi:hypothetical protein